MSGSRYSIDDLIRDAEAQHAQYLRTMRELHEAMSSGGGGGGERGENRSVDGQSPRLQAVSRIMTSGSDFQGMAGPPRARRFTNDMAAAENRRLSGLAGRPHVAAAASVWDGETSDEDDVAEPLALNVLPLLPPPAAGSNDGGRTTVRKIGPLPSESFSDAQLVQYLKTAEFGEGTQIALGNLYKTREDLDVQTIFEAREDEEDVSATYEVYDVLAKDNVIEARHKRIGDEVLPMSVVWETIKGVNDDSERRPAVGRLTLFQEPSPRMLGALHMTMQQHFDMDELVGHLTTTDGNKGKTRAFMNRAHEVDTRRQRSFFFVFRYYTVVAPNVDPAPWQAYDRRPAESNPDHIDITECASVLALSLSGEACKTITPRHRRMRPLRADKPSSRPPREGKLFDTFAPWHLLSVQFFPDDLHTTQRGASLSSPSSSSNPGGGGVAAARQQLVSGPYAFLDSLATEYRDAAARNGELHARITKLITPPNTFMFDVRLRDKLLFEDKHFTYSRRYFWAYNTLGVINDGLASMVAAYEETFGGRGSDFWAGRHATLWPHPAPDGAEGLEYARRMEALRHELEAAVAELKRVQVKNEATRQEIKSLRDQLFSGSSVKESRRAIDQGDNINALTSLSMVFLPLSFVTGVFGITTFDIPTDDWRFPITMVLVSAPFILLIFLFRYLQRLRDGALRTYAALRRHLDGQHHHHHGHNHRGGADDVGVGVDPKLPGSTSANGYAGGSASPPTAGGVPRTGTEEPTARRFRPKRRATMEAEGRAAARVERWQRGWRTLRQRGRMGPGAGRADATTREERGEKDKMRERVAAAGALV